MLHQFAPDAHGTNLVALWNDTGDSPGAVRAFSQMGLGLVRFPGGVPAQWYDWKEPLATGWTELTPERAWRMAQAGGARMVFQTNSATSEGGVNESTGKPYKFDNSAAHQAEWVSFSRAKGIGVAFWEIGNEPEMDAPKPLKADQAAVYAWYNKVFGEQARAIKALDPQARVLGPASTNTWFWWHEGNLAKFLGAHGNKRGTGLVDAVSLHWYPDGGAGPWESKRGEAQGWADAMKFIRGVIGRERLAPAAAVRHRVELGGRRGQHLRPEALQRPGVRRHRRHVPAHGCRRAHALLPAEDRPQLGRAGHEERLPSPRTSPRPPTSPWPWPPGCTAGSWT